MAFSWFRKRQKMVMIIMVVLMVSFLIGFQGFEAVFNPKPGKAEIGKSANGKLLAAQLWDAASDMEVLERYLDLGDLRRMAPQAYNIQGQPQMFPTDLEFWQLRNTEEGKDHAAWAYALLLQAAQEQGFKVSDTEVETFMARAGQAQVDQIASNVANDHRGKDLRQVVKNWLLINKAYAAASSDYVPSEAELQRLFRDVMEKISLRVLKVPAGDFVAKAPQPTEDQIKQQFEKFRNAPTDKSGKAAYTAENPFGFSYQVPDKVAVRYLLVKQEPVEKVARPSDDQMLQYYKEHRAEFVYPESKATTTSAPATASAPVQAKTNGTSRPTTKPGDQMDYARSKPLIRKLLKDQAVQAKMDEIINACEKLTQEAAGNGVSSDKIYQRVKEQMTSPAGAVMDRKLAAGDVNAIANKPLSEVLGILAEKAELPAIVYPLGKQGGVTIDPQILITLKAAGPDMTLAQALEQVTRQVFGPQAATQLATASAPATQATTQARYPSFVWYRCAQLDDAIFPVDAEMGIDMFPIAAGASPLEDVQTMRDDPVLGMSITAIQQGRSLMEIAFTSEPFAKNNSSRLKVDEPGQRMLVLSEDYYIQPTTTGRLLWRMTDAVPNHVPSDVAEVREQVVKDLKLVAAFEMASQKADQIAAEAAKTGLEAAAKANNMKTFTTDPFGRQAIQQQSSIQEAARSGPYAIGPSGPRGIYVRGADTEARLVEKAFSLAPANIDPPYPKEPAVAVMPLPSMQDIGAMSYKPDPAVLVMQREDFQPAVKSAYDQQKSGLMQVLASRHQMQNMRAWFDYAEIVKRYGFVEQRGK